jgi:hypothetical protein
VNSYLQHQDDLASAESELVSLNTTIENLLALKAAKQHDKKLLENAVQHDRSVVDEHGQIIPDSQLIPDNEEVDDDSDEIQQPSSSHSRVNMLHVSSSSFSSSALIIASSQMRSLWC